MFPTKNDVLTRICKKTFDLLARMDVFELLSYFSDSNQFFFFFLKKNDTQ